jgi:hypothetical protein
MAGFVFNQKGVPMTKNYLRWTLALVLLPVATAYAKTDSYSTSDQASECDSDLKVSPEISAVKTATLANKAGTLREYGQVEFRHNASDAEHKSCHVVYRLFLAKGSSAFEQIDSLEWDTEDSGEIAGIDLIGFSLDGSEAAANFWLAAGDGQDDRPVVYDLITHKVSFGIIGEKLSNQASQNCDAYVQRVEEVTNRGIVLVSVPAYENCADKGLWAFDPRTGSLKRIRKVSGRRRME